MDECNIPPEIAESGDGWRSNAGRLPTPRRRSWPGLGTGCTLALLMVAFSTGSPLSARETGAGAVAPARSVPVAGGEWSDTGPLNAPRNGHTATLLPEGGVLAVGSGGNDSAAPAVPEIEIYSPGTGAWTMQASLRPPRRRHCATLLPDGLVLVAGGDGGQGQAQLPGALTFAPAGGALTGAGTLARPRSFCTLTALTDGRALLIGGGDPGFLAEVEVFDPATSAWTVVGALKQARAYHTATLLPDGSVLLAGGAGAGGRLASLERFDPRTGQSTIVATMSTPRGFHTATLLPDGTVLLAGGDGGGGDGFPATAERFDPATNTLRPAGAMRGPRRYHTATLLPDGLVLVAGGDKNGPLATTELYDPAGDTWSEAAPLRWPRRWHTATLLPDGRVLVAGGEGEGGSLASAEIYTPAPPPCADPPPALAAWWPLDETSGATAEDIAGNNDGAFVNQPAVVADGYVATSRRFDGATQSIQVPDPADGALDFGFGDFTVDAWVRLDADARGVRTILDKRAFSPVRGYAVFAIDGKLALQLGDGSAPGNACGPDPATTPCTSYNSGLAINDGQWHFVAVTVDRDGAGVFHVDGQTASFDASRRAGSLDNAAPLTIARHATSGGFWKGGLDEVEVFGRAVPAAELAAIRRAAGAGKCKRPPLPEQPMADRNLLGVVQEIFEPLVVSAIPSGILLDRTPLLSTLGARQPVTDSHLIHRYANLRQVYLELWNSALRRDGMPSPEELAARVKAYEEQGAMPIPVLAYRFDRIREDALAKNLLVMREGRVHDVPGRQESPYVADSVVVAAPSVATLPSGTVTVTVASDLILSNWARVRAVSIDFDDGLGFRALALDTPVVVRYTSTGEKHVKVRLDLDEASATGPRATTSLELESSLTPLWLDLPQADAYWYANDQGVTTVPGPYRSTVGILYGAGHKCLANPMLFVEGIDFGQSVRFPPFLVPPPLIWNNHGTLSLVDFMTGTNPDYPQFNEAPKLLDDLLEKGYDVMYVDFWDGATYIQDNARVLERVIEHILKVRCSTNETLMVAASMGGVIGRMALTQMEQSGRDACVQEYLSFDAPHEGANIVPGGQHWVQFFSPVSDEARKARDEKLARPAARQLLLYHYGTPGSLKPDPLRVALTAQLGALGYPRETRNVAVINGSRLGQKSGTNPTKRIDPGDLLLEYRFNKSIVYAVHTTAHAAPGGGESGTLFEGYLVIPTKGHVDTQKDYAAAGMPLLDSPPGGMTDVLGALSGPQFSGSTYLGWAMATQMQSAFIPAVSALGIKTEELFLPLNDAKSLVQSGLTPFQDYFAPADNEMHMMITKTAAKDGNADWLMKELARIRPKPNNVLGTGNPAYNYGHALHLLTPWIVVNGARLSVNDLGPTGLLTEPDTVPGSTFQVRTSPCSPANVAIEDGEFALGSASGNKGLVRFTHGSLLYLGEAGKLVVHDGSRLVIEPGARLTVKKGAQIQLLGNDAVLEIRGKVTLGDGADFSFTGAGRMVFDDRDPSASTFEAGVGSTITLTGSGPTDRVLEVRAGSQLYPESELKQFWVKGGEVHAQGDLLLASRYRLENTRVFGGGTFRAFGAKNSLIADSTFDGVPIEFFKGLGGALRIHGSTLRGTATAVTLWGGGLDFDQVTVQDVATALFAYGPTRTSYIRDSTIQASSSGIADFGSAGAKLVVSDSEVYVPAGVAIAKSGGEIALRAVRVRGLTGVAVGQDAVLDMSTVTGAGCNDLSYTSHTVNTLISLNQAQGIALDSGYNRLFNGKLNNSTNPALNGGTILQGSLQAKPNACQLSATANRWSYTDPLAQPQGFPHSPQLVLGAPACLPEVQVVDSAPSDACPEAGDPDPNPWPGHAAALSVCPTCPTLNTSDFRGVPYNQAITQAMAKLARDSGDPAKDDLVAIRQFSQILGTPVDISKPELAWLRGFAFRMLNDGFGNALATERISTTVAAGPLPEPVRQVQAAYAFLAGARNTPDRGERFRYELGGALVHRQVGRLAEASAALAVIDTVRLTRDQRDSLAAWQRLVAAEERLARGEISPEMFRELVRGPAPYVPPAAPVYLPLAWQARR